MTKRFIGVLGATSMVGCALLNFLKKADLDVIAFSRNSRETHDSELDGKIAWHQFGQSFADASQVESETSNQQVVSDWICLMPIWVLPDYLDWMKSLGAKRIVALSSTSRFTKAASQEASDAAIVKKLVEGEERLIQWAKEHEVEWVILRPTLIYGGGKDKNISTIAHFIRRFGFFPILSKGQGYRQPIHVDGVAMACYLALNQGSVSNQAYNISGDEIITYREMVNRIFTTLGKKPRIISLPLPVLRIGLTAMKTLPRYRRLNLAMITRMNQDMVFDHDAATRDFGFSPQPFELKKNDLEAQ